MKKLITTVAFLCLITSCGKSTSSSKSSKKIIPLSTEEIEYITQNQSMWCGANNSYSCPDGIARLVILNIQNRDLSGVCSGFMISDKVLLTNHHCIDSQSTCDNTYIMVRDNYGLHKTKCSKLLKSEKASYDTDYAIVKIEDEYSGPHFNISTGESLSEYEKLTSWVIDHFSATQFRVTELSGTYQKETNSIGSLHMTTRTAIIDGNSGSPVLNSSGEVVGIIWGSSDVNNLISSDTPLDQRRSETRFNGVFNPINLILPEIERALRQ